MKTKKKSRLTPFEICLYIIFGILALITLYPIYNVLIVSISNTVASAKYSPYLYPHVFDLTGYKAIIKDVYFFKSLGVRNVVDDCGNQPEYDPFCGWRICIQQKTADGKKLFALSAILFTMLFSGGLIPALSGGIAI